MDSDSPSNMTLTNQWSSKITHANKKDTLLYYIH